MRKRPGEGCSFVAEQLQELADAENINSSHVSSWEAAHVDVCTDSQNSWEPDRKSVWFRVPVRARSPTSDLC